jgi:hypothetical protein
MHNITRILNYTLIVAIVVAAVAYFYLREFRYQGKDHNELENFSIIEQPDNLTCGPTSVAMVLKYYGKPHEIDDIRKQTKTDLWTTKDGKKLGGTQPLLIKVALIHYGVPTKMGHGNLDKLKYYIDQGIPVIVLVRSDKFLMHFVVVIGYTQKEIIIADPDGQREVLDNDKFKGCWSFKTDMDGIDPHTTCPACKGKGYIGIRIIGKCDLCAGTGKIDTMAELLTIFETRENTMIMPTIPPPCHSLNDAPKVTQTKLGINGDPINIGLIGTKDEIMSAMIAAKWQPADPITFKSCVKLAQSVILHKPDETAPVSNLYLWKRKQDLAFEQEVGNDARSRHHVRFWESATQVNDRSLWIGAATFDTKVGFTKTGMITHHIDPNIDVERNKLLDDLKPSLSSVETINFQTQHDGKNGGGDPYHTDGNLLLGTLMSNIKPNQKP